MVEDKTCGICINEISDKYTTQCGHEFCILCIYTWINKQREQKIKLSCPSCHSSISYEDVKNKSSDENQYYQVISDELNGGGALRLLRTCAPMGHLKLGEIPFNNNKQFDSCEQYETKIMEIGEYYVNVNKKQSLLDALRTMISKIIRQMYKNHNTFDTEKKNITSHKDNDLQAISDEFGFGKIPLMSFSNEDEYNIVFSSLTNYYRLVMEKQQQLQLLQRGVVTKMTQLHKNYIAFKKIEV
jgi:hypothetical protein